jgi:hypothetical protein
MHNQSINGPEVRQGHRFRDCTSHSCRSCVTGLGPSVRIVMHGGDQHCPDSMAERAFQQTLRPNPRHANLTPEGQPLNAVKCGCADSTSDRARSSAPRCPSVSMPRHCATAPSGGAYHATVARNQSASRRIEYVLNCDVQGLLRTVFPGARLLRNVPCGVDHDQGRVSGMS